MELQAPSTPPRGPQNSSSGSGACTSSQFYRDAYRLYGKDVTSYSDPALAEWVANRLLRQGPKESWNYVWEWEADVDDTLNPKASQTVAALTQPKP